MRRFSFGLLASSVLGVFLISLCATGAFAQGTTTGTIHGAVKDQNGAVVAGANVTVRNEATGVEHKATSGEDGSFVLGQTRQLFDNQHSATPTEMREEDRGMMGLEIKALIFEVLIFHYMIVYNFIVDLFYYWQYLQGPATDFQCFQSSRIELYFNNDQFMLQTSL